MRDKIVIEPRPQRDLLAQTQPRTRHGRVLLAEDDDEMRHLVADCLAREGHEVVQASDGPELVDRVTDSLRDGLPVDLVISDLRMPGLTGFEALEWLRALGCRAPVILITAFGDRSTHLEGVRQGVVRVLDKPFDLDELRGLTRDLFAPPRRRRIV